MRFFFQLIGLTIVMGWVCQAFAQQPYPPLRNYTAEEAEHIGEQNYDIIQDDQGIMYFANTYGILMYDGKTWQALHDDIEHNVLSLAKGETGRIYVGSVNQIGYLEKTDRHNYEFVSIVLDSQLIQPSKIGKVWKIIPREERVLFLTDNEIISWYKEERPASVIRTPYSFDQGLFEFRDTVFVHESLVGLFRLEGDSLVRTKHSRFFEDKFIYALLPAENKQMKLAVTFRSGLYKITPGGVTAWETEADHFLKTQMTYCAIRLHNGWYAIGTLKGGVIIIDQEGKVRYKIDKAHGLLEDNTVALYQDQQNHVWLGLRKGIAYFKLSTPFSYINNNQKDLQRIRDIAKLQNHLYVGTSRGTFKYSSVRENTEKLIQPVPKINTFTRDFLIQNDTLLVASNGGVYQIVNDAITTIADKRARCLLMDKNDPRQLWVGTDEGLGYFEKKKGKWHFSNMVNGIEHDIKYIAQDTTGVLWLGTQFNGVYRLEYDLTEDRPREIKRFYTNKGLPESFTYPALVMGQIVFRTGRGLYYFDQTEKKFRPFTRYSKAFHGKDGFVPWDFTIDTAGYTWVATSNRFGRLSPTDNGYRWDSTASLRIRDNEIRTIYADENNKIWLGTYNSLIYYDPAKKVNFKPAFPALLNHIQLNSDSTLMPGHVQANKQPEEIIYDMNTLTFRYTLPDYFRPAANEFRTYLEGFDDHWSDWTGQSKKRYTNLPPGRYTFHVKARNLYRQEASPASYTFYILPPWYRTYWAYTGYLLLLLGITIGAVRINARRLRAHNRALDRVVQSKTEEVIAQHKRIKQQKDNLAKQNRQLERNNKQLKEAKKRAEESERVKERFLANAAHELRTPLNAVVGMANLLSETELPGKQQEYIKAIKLSTDSLLDIVRDVLDISKIQAGKITFHKKEFMLENVFKSVRNTAKYSLKDKDIEFSDHIDEDIPPVLIGDPVRLTQILFNLVSNALKFTKEGQISLKTELVKEQGSEVVVSFTILDTGTGIPPDKLSIIFEPFAQAGREISQQAEGGTGLGLMITRQLIELQNGNIDVNSQPDKGTRIHFPLPFEKSDKMKLSKEVSVHKKGKNKLSHLRFLMVEDNRMNQLVAKSILEKWDCPYDIVENGEDCIAELKKNPERYDVILMDVQMPIMDGYEATQIIRNEMEPPLRDIPIIAMTAHASEKEGEKCLAAGMDSYLFKPFEPEDLYKRLEQLLEE